MPFSPGKISISLEELYKYISPFHIITRYFNIKKIPCLINSPFRKDKNPSFAIYSPNNKDINYRDFATGDSGDLISLLSSVWGLNRQETIGRIWEEMSKDVEAAKVTKTRIARARNSGPIDIQIKIRKWEKYDLEFWNSFGITGKWLNLAEIYPISHKIIIKDNQKYVFGADKYAYAYVERKEGKVSIKIYQPFNKKGFKWATSTDSSVISLWTKVPEKGDRICICSSMKDALCLWANTGIPSIAIQGEGYNISETAKKELKKRFTNVYILLDNDAPGLEDGVKLSNSTGFKNLILPSINGAKDISDLYKSLNNKKQFKDIILKLFN